MLMVVLISEKDVNQMNFLCYEFNKTGNLIKGFVGRIFIELYCWERSVPYQVLYDVLYVYFLQGFHEELTPEIGN